MKEGRMKTNSPTPEQVQLHIQLKLYLKTKKHQTQHRDCFQLGGMIGYRNQDQIILVGYGQTIQERRGYVYFEEQTVSWVSLWVYLFCLLPARFMVLQVGGSVLKKQLYCLTRMVPIRNAFG